MNERVIKGGVYLVIDPSMEIGLLADKLKEALEGGISVVQLWNNWPETEDKAFIAEKICEIVLPYRVPVLVNENRALLLDLPMLDGIHFDNVPDDYEILKNSVARPFLCGITCSNDLRAVHWARENHLDYVSFCSMFPSSNAQTCEIVVPENIRKARMITEMPLFVAGGITPGKIADLRKTIPFDGVAVISGIMNSENPKQTVNAYLNALTK